MHLLAFTKLTMILSLFRLGKDAPRKFLVGFVLQICLRETWSHRTPLMDGVERVSCLLDFVLYWAQYLHCVRVVEKGIRNVEAAWRCEREGAMSLILRDGGDKKVRLCRLCVYVSSITQMVEWDAYGRDFHPFASPAFSAYFKAWRERREGKIPCGLVWSCKSSSTKSISWASGWCNAYQQLGLQYDDETALSLSSYVYSLIHLKIRNISTNAFTFWLERWDVVPSFPALQYLEAIRA